MADQQVNENSTGDDRPLRLRMRPDLQCNKQTFQGGDFWVIKDPLSMRFFRFYEEEYFLLCQLDGKRSTEQIQKEFHRQFAPQRLTLSEVHQLVGMLFRNSLVVSDAPENGDQLLRRYRSNTRREQKAQLTNILSYRFPGFDPGRILDSLAPWTNWLFTLPATLFVLLVGLFALTIIGTHFEEFQQRLPSFQQFFAAQNWLWLAVTLSLTKVVHELGHGLACRRFGSQCHEMGVMFLVLTPCLYCNVSDSWTIPSKWRRIYISAAGMYVELAMAAVACIVWWYSVPGIVHYMALNIIFVCGVSTLLFNLNPLLRYDGYYILADLLEIPNLRQKASRLLESKASQFFLGLPSPVDPFLPNHHVWLFIFYSVAAAVYRWVLTASIFWFLYKLLDPYGLKIISQGLALFSIYGLVVMPFAKMYRFFSIPGRIHTVKPIRLVTTVCVLGLILAGFLCVPLPHYIDSPVYIRPKGIENVYVNSEGAVTEVFVKPGQSVKKGQQILQLQSLDLNTQLLEAKTELEVSRVHSLMVRKLQSAGDPGATFLSAPSKARERSAQSKVQAQQNKLHQLTIRSPIGGTVLAAQSVLPPNDSADQLPGLIGHALQPRNRNAVLMKQTLVCQIVPDFEEWEAILLVDQNDVEFAKIDQDVKIWLSGIPGKIFRVQVQEVAVDPVETVPDFLAGQNGGSIDASKTASGAWRPASAKFQVKVSLKKEANQFTKDNTGTARIHVGYKTAGQQIWRFLAHTFRFEL